MVRNTRKTADETPATTAFGMPLPAHLKDSAQHIWLAGLGAFAKAQEQGGKAFENLVNDGLALQRKTQALAEERIHEAASRLGHLGSEFSSRATGQMDKLENIFEDRVAKALNKLGVPSLQDMAALLARMEALEREWQQQKQPAKAASRTPARRTKAATPQVAAPASKVPRKTPPRKT